MQWMAGGLVVLGVLISQRAKVSKKVSKPEKTDSLPTPIPVSTSEKNLQDLKL